MRVQARPSIQVLFPGCVNALQACVYLLVEFQVKDERCAKGLHQEAALCQMNGLREGGREIEVYEIKTRRSCKD